MLEQHCVACHGPEKQLSGFRLDSRDALLKGGYSGTVVELKQSAKSRLIQMLAGTDAEEVVMPPKGDRLTAEQIGLFRAWIDSGAAWPAGTILTSKSVKTADKGKSHWAFQPGKRPALPSVKHAAAVRNEIDQFILARLEAEGIEPSPAADAATLMRRVTLDLTGLPPTPKEIEAFVSDTHPDAYAHLVDRLLASPHFGERWGRSWLDMCHYADSDGYLQDFLRPYAWRYREWLVDALNRDLPYDQFTILQIAGDLLPNATTDQQIATGFLRQTLSNREGGADLEQFRVEKVVDRTMMVGTVWLGMTVGCARCHDHKYDPVSQKEFFELYSFLDSADEVNINAPLPHEVAAYDAKKPEYDKQRAEILKPVAKELETLQADWEKKMLAAIADPGKDYKWEREWEVLGLVWGQNFGEGQLEGTEIVRLDASKRTQYQKDRLQDYFLRTGASKYPKESADLKVGEIVKALQKLESELPKVTRAQVMQETQTPRPVSIHLRGEFRTPGIRVSPGTPAVLPRLASSATPNRLDLARWIVARENPLTARVAVNRLWQELFGTGIVLTSEDFGTQGSPPSHPQLLDWLASEFMERGWSTKGMLRLMVMSGTYRQSSRPRTELTTRDPHNRLLARQSSLRLSADQLRDVTLAVSGQLNPKIGGPSVFPQQPDAVSMESFDNKWVVSEGADRYRRGIYTWVQRLSPFAMSITFDAPGTTRICTRRERSNTPLQALTLLNDPQYFEAAQSLAARLLKESPVGTTDRLNRAFLLCLGRRPSANEADRLLAYQAEQTRILKEQPQLITAMSPSKVEGVDPLEAAIWTGVSSILLNLHEFIVRD